MGIALDHLIVPARDRVQSAAQLARILGVPWSPTGIGPFSPVYVDAGLTLDFDQWDGDALPKLHFCFRVGDAEFDAILARLRDEGIPWRGTPHGPMDGKVNTVLGGRIAYWEVPDGHVWEASTTGDPRPAATPPP